MSRTQHTGREGELLAARYLKQLGYELLAMNFHTRFGEIDLIALDGETVVFVEVKTRKNADFAPAFSAVTPAKQERLRLTALEWLAQKGERPARFDVVEVYTGTRQVQHIKDAFT